MVERNKAKIITLYFNNEILNEKVLILMCLLTIIWIAAIEKTENMWRKDQNNKIVTSEFLKWIRINISIIWECSKMLPTYVESKSF